MINVGNKTVDKVIIEKKIRENHKANKINIVKVVKEIREENRYVDQPMQILKETIKEVTVEQPKIKFVTVENIVKVNE